MVVDKCFLLTKPQEEKGFDLTQSEDKKRYLKARDGDHLMMSFQYDLCHFRNLMQKGPVHSEADIRLVMDIRCVNLDAFWAREPGTVGATKREGVKIGKLGDSMGLSNIIPATGPFPVEDTMGMGIAVCMLQHSLDKGRYQNNLQFETVRKLRSS